MPVGLILLDSGLDSGPAQLGTRYSSVRLRASDKSHRPDGVDCTFPGRNIIWGLVRCSLLDDLALLTTFTCNGPLAA